MPVDFWIDVAERAVIHSVRKGFHQVLLGGDDESRGETEAFESHGLSVRVDTLFSEGVIDFGVVACSVHTHGL